VGFNESAEAHVLVLVALNKSLYAPLARSSSGFFQAVVGFNKSTEAQFGGFGGTRAVAEPR
jgi:hypothetical protein